MTNPTDHPPERNSRDEFVDLVFTLVKVYAAGDFAAADRLRAEVLRLYDAAASQPVAGVEFVRGLQQRCVDWNAYWRAPDAHGVDLTIEQATELLRDVLSVEVKIAAPPKAEPAGWRLVPVEPTPEMIEAVSKVMLARIMSKRDGRDIKFGITENWQTMIQAAPAQPIASVTIPANTLKVGDVINITPPPMGEPK